MRRTRRRAIRRAPSAPEVPPLSTPRPVAICVPVRNEEAALPSLLDALAALDTGGGAVAACFLLDECADRSEAVLRGAAARFPYPVMLACGGPNPAPNAGRARRAAMAMALGRAGPDALLLTTDADSRPRPDWLTAARRALAVADVAAGRVVRSGDVIDPIQDRVEAHYDRLHAYRRRIDPVPWDSGGCHHGGGANLGVRADVYRALGGFRPIASGEDAALLDDAARAGFRVRRDPAMLVETSSRRHGRAPGGLAAALREIDAGGPPRVSHPAAAAWQYGAQAEARRAFPRLADAGVRDLLGSLIGLTGDHVLGVARDCPNAEAFATRIVPAGPGADRLVALAEAEEALAGLECGPRERAA